MGLFKKRNKQEEIVPVTDDGNADQTPDRYALIRELAKQQAREDADYCMKNNIQPTPAMRQVLAKRRAEEAIKKLLGP